VRSLKSPPSLHGKCDDFEVRKCKRSSLSKHSPSSLNSPWPGEQCRLRPHSGMVERAREDCEQCANGKHSQAGKQSQPTTVATHKEHPTRHALTSSVLALQSAPYQMPCLPVSFSPSLSRSQSMHAGMISRSARVTRTRRRLHARWPYPPSPLPNHSAPSHTQEQHRRQAPNLSRRGM